MSSGFNSVLVANRGEIAARVLRTLRAQGIEGIVVHHAIDTNSPAVRMADRAIEIQGPTPVAAYLDGEQILRSAKDAGAQAIHPGYGFLSENASFARRAKEEGIVFIGPGADAIALMGDKVRARNFVAEHGFPVAPSAIEDDDPASFIERARAVGAPLLIKPAAGGGGKGMHIVRDLAHLESEIARARSEGERYFGDGRLYVERYVENPRHIEVQILGDMHGNLVHLFERECSLQRRFQKVVEEAPSPALTPQLRTRICETAAGIARAANYANAGTVEFIYSNGEFYFLEMNTRLQVEHPVTEMITGLDLVGEQLRLAAGEPLGYGQSDIAISGHAIEARLYAEDPARDFAPVTGKILAYAEPAGEGIRVDSGVAKGQAVTAAFDPMLAKLIVHAPDRDAALTKADSALADFVLLGLKTNVGFLRHLLADADVRAANIHTGLIGEKPQLLSDPEPDARTIRRALAAGALALRPVREAADLVPALHARMGGWRN
jgi:propionyl-CoA carboxylase alpha chain/3-methylcrotonyl-CoA carboxylase alpha subunit/acetyl-CoA/propionyl-CoA carboxylase biotin carboxyl carrier protein